MQKCFRKIRSSLILIILASIVFNTLAYADLMKKSVIKLIEPVYDFGTVMQGEKILHEFAIKNEGDQSLVIQKIIPACGCTAASIDGNSIAPGKVGKIKVEFDSNGLSGEKIKTVRLYTNDIDTPSVLLTLKGVVEPDVVVEPSNIAFNEVIKSAEKPPAQTVRITARKGSNAEIMGLVNYSKYIKVIEIESSNQSKIFEVSLDPNTPVGELRERLIINIGGTKIKAINVPVYASVKGNLKLDPSQVSFGIIEGEKEIRRNIKFENIGAEPIKILSVNSDNHALKADFKTIKEGFNYVITLSLEPKDVIRDLRATVDVFTNSSKQEKIAISAYGVTPPK